MQENNNVWQKTDKEYDFKAIYFFWHDITPWAQTFLLSRIDDKSWAPVYTDKEAIIFLKRNEENKNIIAKYELPRSMFSATH